MSLILDALRKMEQERRSRRGAAQDLRPEVLRYRTADHAKQPARYPLLLIGAVLLCAGIAAGVMLRGKQQQVLPQAKLDAAVTNAAAPSPSPVEAPAVVPPVPAAPPAPVFAFPAAPAAPAAPVAPVVAEPVRPKAPRESAAPSRPAPVEALPQARSLNVGGAEVQAGMPDIAISGIAYQDERRLRRAVLNGILVGEGAEIAGARVVEIKETKVRLSRGGQVFEVPFSSGFPSH